MHLFEDIPFHCCKGMHLFFINKVFGRINCCAVSKKFILNKITKQLGRLKEYP